MKKREINMPPADKAAHASLTFIFIYVPSDILFEWLSVKYTQLNNPYFQIFLFLVFAAITLSLGFRREYKQAKARCVAAGHKTTFHNVMSYFDHGDMRANYLGAFISLVYFLAN